jgi:hypothetical protein
MYLPSSTIRISTADVSKLCTWLWMLIWYFIESC